MDLPLALTGQNVYISSVRKKQTSKDLHFQGKVMDRFEKIAISTAVAIAVVCLGVMIAVDLPRFF